MANRLYRASDADRAHSTGRAMQTSEEPYRSPFRKDYARLIHSSAFRRLVGKTQLFPAFESDFFRNRLTHSLEVAQVAKSLANKLNHEEEILTKNPIDTDLVETVAIAHDLGHPPFGHNGELALDRCMLSFGGFEGNAQSLRILARIEKKSTADPESRGINERGDDLRFGLNLTARTLAGVLKYDNSIKFDRSRSKYTKPVKGYYKSEAGLVDSIKSSVLGKREIDGTFKTVECQVMDIADDIAYSTYDLEDAFKAGFLTPVDIIAAKTTLLQAVADEIASTTDFDLSAKEVRATLIEIFGSLFNTEFMEGLRANRDKPHGFASAGDMITSYQTGIDISKVGYLRTAFTSELVGDFIRGIRFKPNRRVLPLSKVWLDESVAIKVEILKRFTYISLIMSPRLKVAELRGQEIVQYIFKTLVAPDGYQLLPEDCQEWFARSRKKADKMRVVCDFIAGMTDNYAVEFYSRLTSATPQSIFKPI